MACSRGFEVVSLETLETQPLLDHADTSLDFVTRKEVAPISIERLNGEFLLHYNEFSFFVNRNGWRARPDWKIDWEGRPNTFAMSHPYLLAFEPSFIEIRHLETSALVHVITAKNVRMLHSSTREVGHIFFLVYAIRWKSVSSRLSLGHHMLTSRPLSLPNSDDLLISDFVRIRGRWRRRRRGQPGFLEQAAALNLLYHMNALWF